jgi:RsiW-degrading membrane proteinase PrsW (M82 family)
MARRRDPVEESATEGTDLYDVATWERRTAFDKFAAVVHGLLLLAGRVAVVLAALAILVAQLALGGLSAARTDPTVLAAVVLSVVPALLLAAYVWRSDVTDRQPVSLLVATFLLGVLFATFAAVANTVLQVAVFGPVFGSSGLLAGVGLVLFFYLVVAPVEEAVKLLAVRLYAFQRFSAVVDGAVYGAAAGLGFATIENYIYITRSVAASGDATLLSAAGGIAAVRALAGPGHVIYSALAGYYLGLARFNPEDAGPIVVKGLLLAAFVHGTYNVLAGPVSGLLGATVAWADGPWVGYVAFVVAYDGLFGLLLYRKLRNYGRAYREATADEEPPTADGQMRIDPEDVDP